MFEGFKIKIVHLNTVCADDFCDFDAENTNRKPPLILKMVPEAGYDVYTRKVNLAEKQRR